MFSTITATFSFTEAYWIFDDTVINKKYGYNIELTRRQYSGNEHQVVRGIGIVNCVYFNPQNKQLWIIDYRIYDPDTDKKTKIVECWRNDTCMAINNKKIPFKTVLMDLGMQHKD